MSGIYPDKHCLIYDMYNVCFKSDLMYYELGDMVIMFESELCQYFHRENVCFACAFPLCKSIKYIKSKLKLVHFMWINQFNTYTLTVFANITNIGKICE